MGSVRVILRDQLSLDISSLQECDKKNDRILICETLDDATYVHHHQKKLVFILSAMRHFAKELKAKGYQVHYVPLDHPKNSQSLTKEVASIVKKYHLEQVFITYPSEYRIVEEVKTWKHKVNAKIIVLEDNRFLCSMKEFAAFAKSKKSLLMEHFYEKMRKKYQILVSKGKPIGGQWNFDAKNREPLNKKIKIPKPFRAQKDAITKQVITLVKKKFSKHFGDIEPFHFAVTRKQALAALKHFIKYRLKHFGPYQDAMIEQEPWMFHSHLSFYLNIGLLNPLECIEAACDAYKKKKAPINSVEGFVRQILGWREFVRGVYWMKMPSYTKSNFLRAKRKLPQFYWSGKTNMNCLKQCVLETQKYAYAHHIQRLMVLGNFALLAGVDPKFVNEWYLIVYADAYQWVELPNVSGMVLFADGGYLATKPYASGGAYIHKMSNYCENCHYNVKEKEGKEACPFNYLYWDFLIRHRSKLIKNPRLKMIYQVLKKMSPSKQKQINKDARSFLNKL